MRWRAAFVLACGIAFSACSIGRQPDHVWTRPGVTLTPCRVAGVPEELRCGVYQVFENRTTRQGRKLPLKIVLIPARRLNPSYGPVFFLAGGPGETATELAAFMKERGDSEEQDVVLVDQRGTGDGHRLDCPSPGSDENLEGYLKGPFDHAAARACHQQLSRSYDLSQYTTEAFVEDLDEVRRALGYEKINLHAGSFGTYAALRYIRRHGEYVRSAYLVSLVTSSNRVPLYHARAAQYALDQLFRQCDQDAACDSVFPRFPEDFATVLERVRREPVLTWVRLPVTGEKAEVRLTAPAFADAVRVMMYSSERARRLPLLIRQAKDGDFRPFAEVAVRASRGMYTGARVGLNYAVTCNEFVNRIRPEEVGPATAPSFLGAGRVKNQMEACKDWPRTGLPADLLEPFRSSVPAVLVSGDTDPVSPPNWGEEVKQMLSNSVHVVIPGGAHTPENDCTRSIRHQLFRDGAIEGLDTSCVARLRPPAFQTAP